MPTKKELYAKADLLKRSILMAKKTLPVTCRAEVVDRLEARRREILDQAMTMKPYRCRGKRFPWLIQHKGKTWYAYWRDSGTNKENYLKIGSLDEMSRTEAMKMVEELRMKNNIMINNDKSL